jgi:peptidyl-prolyl cis-trans isomerase SurA
MTKELLENYKTILEDFQTTGVLPSELESLETNVLGEISEDGLNNKLKQTLKNTNEGDFSNPILVGDYYKSFFVRSKDLAESEVYQEAKNRINARLFEEKAIEAIELWYDREETNHYVRYF